MEESEVDDLLGERSYSGGDLPGSVLDEVDLFKNTSNEVSHLLFFNDSDDAKKFLNYGKQISKEKDLTIDFVYEEIENQDWNQVWREQFKKIEISDEMAVIPITKLFKEKFTHLKLCSMVKITENGGNQRPLERTQKIWNQEI